MVPKALGFARTKSGLTANLRSADHDVVTVRIAQREFNGAGVRVQARPLLGEPVHERACALQRRVEILSPALGSSLLLCLPVQPTGLVGYGFACRDPAMTCGSAVTGRGERSLRTPASPCTATNVGVRRKRSRPIDPHALSPDFFVFIYCFRPPNESLIC